MPVMVHFTRNLDFEVLRVNFETKPKTNGSIARNLYQGDPQLRAGLAIHTTLCGTADVFFGFADG